MGTFSQPGGRRELGDIAVARETSTAGEPPWWHQGDVLRAMLHGLGLGYWAREMGTDRLECSEACRYVFDLDADTKLSTWADLVALVHPDDRARFEETARTALERGHRSRLEHRIVLANGDVRQVTTQCGCFASPTGRIILAGVVVDTAPRAPDREPSSWPLVEDGLCRAIVEQMPSALVVVDVASERIVLTNGAASKIFPRPDVMPQGSSALFRSWRAFDVDGREVPDERRPLARALAGETVSEEELRIVQADGAQAWLRLSSTLVRNAKGTPIAAVILGTNIDQAKRAEEALRASESRLRQLFESPVIAITHATLDGRITSANDTFLSTFGYTRDEIATIPLSWRAMTPPEFSEADDRALDELRSSTRCALVYEKEYFHKTGRRIPIAIVTAMLEGSGTETVSFILDISDRKRADRERERLHQSLAISEERYRLAAMATEHAIYDWHLNTDRVTVHPMMGRAHPPVSSGLSWADSIHPADRERVIAGLNDAVSRGEQHWEAEYRFARGDGTWMNTIDRAFVIRDRDGAPVRMVGAMQDVTARRRQEEFERQLIGIVSHDLKNPLQTVLLASEMMQRSPLLAEPLRKNVDRIQLAGRRASRLIRDLLDFTRARLGGGIPLERRACALAPIFEALIEETRVQHPERTLTLECRDDTTGAFDADRLGQILTNLVDNALKYSSPDAPVAVTLRGERDDVVFTVHNEGPPISSDQRARIFEPMQRGDTLVDPTGRSVGLGLYIVKHLVEAHGGRIEVTSSKEEGTTFTVRLRRRG